MARTRRHALRHAPPPTPAERRESLPPNTRTVGQLVADAIRFYGSRFWACLALGLGPAVVGVTVGAVPGRTQLAIAMTVGAAVMSACYAIGSSLVSGVRLNARSLSTAMTVGVIVATPVPFLVSLLLLPAVAWLGLFGLAVPVAVVERCGIVDSLRRAPRLALADYIHAVGALATLTIVGLASTFALLFVLRGQGEATLIGAAFLSLLVVSPLLFVGASMLYDDQAARAATRE